ncbi:MAG: hypothetical protein C5B53_09520 [Candidatus Melainabacteria bacterium]|nr:MAG: hypothetical protein C5B53_09520 [Candidatus Melainabacteria bacterium]
MSQLQQTVSGRDRVAQLFQDLSDDRRISAVLEALDVIRDMVPLIGAAVPETEKATVDRKLQQVGELLRVRIGNQG